MLDVAIIGAGLSGLSLARRLARRKRDFAVFEARNRLGGRILTATVGEGGGLDLGAGWFWPQTQPLVSALIRELGLPDHPQHDDGIVLHLKEVDKHAERFEDKKLYDGARRLKGGMATLTERLAADLPGETVFLRHQLKAFSDRGDHIRLEFHVDEQVLEIAARRVVLTLPPRLIRETLRIEPRLDEPTDRALLGAETWMAAQAKVGMTFGEAFWRSEGLSGSAYVTHEQAILGEIFDASDIEARAFALGGFVAIDPELRKQFAVGLPILLKSQIGAVFGRDVEVLDIHFQDWANEPFTCSDADRIGQEADHSTDSGNPLLRRALWDKKLYLGGSETSVRNAGYMEGALDAARRVDRALAVLETKRQLTDPAAADPYATLPLNEASLARFAAWVDAQADAVFDDYRRRLNQGLARQEREGLTQAALVGAIEALFEQSLLRIEALPLDMEAVAIEKGRASLTPLIQQPFGEVMQAVFDDAIAFNQTSCALSNFPNEHRVSKDYTQAIMREVAAAWREFSLSANDLLVKKKTSHPAQELIG
jgi:monoamine oxidase